MINNACLSIQHAAFNALLLLLQAALLLLANCMYARTPTRPLLLLAVYSGQSIECIYCRVGVHTAGYVVVRRLILL